MPAKPTCEVCGQPTVPNRSCPHCGHTPPAFAEELARLERDLAEMSAKGVTLNAEMNKLSLKMQQAQHRRNLLAHAQQEQERRNAPKQRSVLRRRIGGGAGTRRRPAAEEPDTPAPPRKTVPPPRPDAARPGTAPPPERPPPPPPNGSPAPPPGGRPRAARGPAEPGGPVPPPRRRDPDQSGQPGHGPEASSGSVQNILLVLGALLLAVAAVVFGAVAISVLDNTSRAGILLLATVAMLLVPSLVARQGLAATAETVAAVGLLLLPLDGYAIWSIDALGLSALPGTLFAGLVCAATVVVAAVYMTLSGLTVPRFAIVLAIQPVLPLLAYEWISGPAGWALVLAAVALVDAGLGGMLGQASLPRVGSAEPAAGDQPDAPGDSADPAGVPAPPPTTTRTQLAVAAATFWLRELTWVMHGLALGSALIYAVVSLLTADGMAAVSRATATLLLASAVGVVGALTLRQRPLPDIAAGVMTIAVVGSASRVAAVALPGRALVLIAAAVALTTVGVRALPAWARRGPQLAAAAALAVLGAVVAGNTARAAAVMIQAALPMWTADLSGSADRLARAAGSGPWQLVVAGLLLTVAAALAIPAPARREAVVAGVAISAVAAPASLGLPWAAGPWLLVTAAVAVAATGLTAGTRRAAATHAVAAGVLALTAGGAALARSGLTAGVLAVIFSAGAMIALAERLTPAPPAGVPTDTWPEQRVLPARRPTALLGEGAAGAAAFALPCAVAAAVTAAGGTITAVLNASFLAVCLTLGYAAVRQVADRQISIPLAVGSGTGALVVAAAAFRGSDHAADLWVGAFLLAAAVLLVLAPSIDAGRRADRLLDGSDVAAAVVTAATIATLARLGALALPGSELATTAALVLLVALGIRAMPEDWRRGPALGSAATGGLIALFAGYLAVRDGIRVLGLPGNIWAANLDAWPGNTAGAQSWQVPVALLLLAAAAAVVLPRPAGYDMAAAGVGLATISAPVALGLAWWSPIVVGGMVATGYGVASVIARDPRAGLARAVLAAAVGLHMAGASLVRPWTTAAALGLIVVVGGTVAAVAVLVARLDLGVDPREESDPDPTRPDASTAHLTVIGGAALAGALLALPGAFAALAAELHPSSEVVLTAALGASSLGLAIVAAARQQVPHYLGYATTGVAAGATITAFACLPTAVPAGVYAAAAALLGVIAELLRAASVQESAVPATARDRGPGWRAPAGDVDAPRPAGAGTGGPSRWRTGRRWSISPARGALTVSVLPAALALATVVPALVTALADPYQTLDAIWAGPPADLLSPRAGDLAGVLAALLLTIAAALAAVGFSTGGLAQATPVILPGAAITLLIAPVSLGGGWPAATFAALIVFTISSLGVALTPPPPESVRAQPLRVARYVVFGIGLLAGGAGLAGSLATRSMTLFTLGGAVLVGLAAALGGRTGHARVLGWLFASGSAQAFVLTAGLVAGLPARSSAFGVLAVGALLLVGSALLPRLRRPESFREAAAVEWSGHAAALLALALTFDSARHVAAVFAAWGAVLGVSATRPHRRAAEQRALFWATIGCELVAWLVLMRIGDVALIEAYTVPFAALALLVGFLEQRHRPDLTSWAAYGPALVAAFLPTLVIVLFTSTTPVRQVALLLAAAATLIAGSIRRQRAPVMIGAIVTALTALRLLSDEYGPWVILVPIGVILLLLGANYEKRRLDLRRLRGAYTRFR